MAHGNTLGMIGDGAENILNSLWMDKQTACARKDICKATLQLAKAAAIVLEGNRHAGSFQTLRAHMIEFDDDAIGVEIEPLNSSITRIIFPVALDMVRIHSQHQVLRIIFIQTLKHQTVPGIAFFICETNKPEVFHIHRGDAIGMKCDHF